MIFDSRGQRQSIGACTNEEKEGNEREKVREISNEAALSRSRFFFFRSFQLWLYLYLDRGIMKFIVGAVNPSTALASILPLLHLHFYHDEVVCTFHGSGQFFFYQGQV